MKNKIVFLGSLCLILALGLVFVGCQDDGPQIVELDSVSSPSNVTVAWEAAVTSGTGQHNGRVVVKWTAVPGVTTYQIVYAQADKKAYQQLANSETGTISSTSYSADFKTQTNTVSDVDQREYRYQINSSTISGTFKVGVIANSANPNHQTNSGVAWAKDAVTIPAYTSP